MTVFRNRKTAEMSGAENRYLFEFRFVRFGYGYILRKQSPQGGHSPSKPTLRPVI